MGERRLAPLAALAGLACCVGTAIAAVALGGVALASLGRFGVISATTLLVVVGVAWLIDQRRGRVGPERSSSDTAPVE